MICEGNCSKFYIIIVTAMSCHSFLLNFFWISFEEILKVNYQFWADFEEPQVALTRRS
jgi:hypothetical protein